MKKHIFACAFAVLSAGSFSAQNEQPDWSTMMKDPSRSFEEKSELHRSFWPTAPAERGQGFKQFERFRWLYETRISEEGTLPTGPDIVRTWEELNSFSSGRSPMGNWNPMGPILDNVTTRDHIEGVGRTSALAFHPIDPDRMICGTPAGGIWLSSDGGQSWTTNTDWLPTLGVSSILYHPENTDLIFAGTGDRDAFDSPGMGVMKSTDGGITWEFANTGIEDITIGSLRYISTYNALIAGTNEGIFRSTDLGETWTQASSNTYDFRDVELHPTNSDIAYATGSGRFYRSADGGVSWILTQDGITSGTRMVIAVTPADPERVYVCRSNTYEFTGFFRSDDAGLTFTQISNEPNILGWAADGSSNGGQAWYDLCIETDWNDADIIYVGGIRMKKSEDGGATWLDINPNYIHVDQHELVISPHSTELYVCNDGGLYRYVNQTDWLDISQGMVCGQIYKLGQNPINPNETLTGFQDNGTAEFNGAIWQRRGGGDGFECIYDYTDPTWRYGSIYYGAVYRTSPDFINQKIAENGHLGITESGAWSSPYTLHPSNDSTMFLGMKNVWRSRNVKTANNDSIVWEKISNNLMGSNTENMIALKFSYADHNILYATKAQRRLARTSNALADEVLWTNLSANLPSSLQPVTCVETHPTDTNTVYIGFNRNVWKSIDGALSWTNLTADFPDVQVNTIVMDTASAMESLYIGTDLGIYYTDNLLGEWISFNDGFPMSSRVTELEIYYGNNPSEHRLKAATYGRGLWESDLYATETYTFAPVALLRNLYATNEVFGEFDADVVFYRNLELVDMIGLTPDDFFVENGSVVQLTGGDSQFVVRVSPDSFGEVKLYLDTNSAQDEMNNGNFASDTLLLMYVPASAPFGPLGPGGVGDDASVTLWLRGDQGVDVIGGNQPLDGMSVQSWNSIAGAVDYSADQSSTSEMPLYVESENGIAGKPAIQFDGENDYLLASGVVPGRSISAYIMVEAGSIAFNDHGWFASARVPNGYLLHPWKDESRYHSEILDLNGDYSGSPVYHIGDGAAPHIYGFLYDQDDLHQVFFTLFDDNLWPFPGIASGVRDATTPIDIRMGWDFDDRFGEGKIGEHILYNRRLFISHHTIVNNYLASRYGIDLGPQRKYHHVLQAEEVIGIGRESEFDFHEMAQGRGIIELSQPTSLDNEDYLLIGQDEGSTIRVENVYPLVSPRMQRTWGASVTSDIGLVKLRVALDQLNEFSNAGVIVANGQAFLPGQAVSFFPFEIVGDFAEVMVEFPSESVFTIGEQPSVSVEEWSQVTVQLYPNPVSDVLEIVLGNTSSENFSFVLTNPIGQEVLRQDIKGRKGQIGVSHLASGVYFARIIVNNHSGKMIPVMIR